MDLEAVRRAPRLELPALFLARFLTQVPSQGARWAFNKALVRAEKWAANVGRVVVEDRIGNILYCTVMFHKGMFSNFGPRVALETWAAGWITRPRIAVCPDVPGLIDAHVVLAMFFNTFS